MLRSDPNAYCKLYIISMIANANRYLISRIIITIIALLGGVLSSKYHGNPDLNWRACWIISAAATVATFVNFTVRGSKDTIWEVPSWRANPFVSRTQPLQFMHFVATTTIAGAFGQVVRSILSEDYTRVPEVCMFAFIGLGILGALRLWMAIFRDRLNRPRNS